MHMLFECNRKSKVKTSTYIANSSPLATFNQGGIIAVNATANVVSQQTEDLPVSWNRFLQGVTSYDNPSSVPQALSVAISCSTTQVTVGVNASTTGKKYMRYIVFGN